MKYNLILSCVFIFITNFVSGQYLKEQEWATLSSLYSPENPTDFTEFLKVRGFEKSEEEHNKYIFYNWKKTDGFYYGVRINKASGQVTYLTNDQSYVLRLLSRFMTDYSAVKFEKQTGNKALHIFESKTSTIAVMLDTSEDPGTHVLFASNR